jgi:hypothetical protein
MRTVPGRIRFARVRGPCQEPDAVHWSASSADGRSTLSIFPTEVWQWSNTGQRSDCQAGDFVSAHEYRETTPGALTTRTRTS